jgi:AcrR family transcriptional regulator
MNRKLTPRGEERRRQLMDFATVRFAENGYHPTSVAEIVTGLGVGKGVFYWYFESKEELLAEILREAMNDVRRAQQQAIRDLDDPVLRIELGIRASAHWTAEHREVQQLTQFAATEARFAPAIRRGRDIVVADLRRHLDDGIVLGIIRSVDSDYIGHAILGLTTDLFRTFIHERGMDPDEVATVASSFVLDGILTEARRPV